ncbi:MAG: ABC transporter permease subunit [Myxococcota bacterium]|nr:ABC transporter permease subunit [Myxococcota bacterium]
MRNTFAIAGRELRSYFATPVGWLSLTGYVFLTGFFFLAFLLYYNEQAATMGFNPYGEADMNVDEWLVAPFFGNANIILLFLCPALTMRLLAEDRKSKSLELLLTSPISTTEIVLGKYLGALGFVLVLFAGTLHYPALLMWMGDPDPGILASCYLSWTMMTACFMAVGLMASAFTENQMVAMILAFGLLLIFWLLGWMESGLGSTGFQATIKEVLSFASLVNRTEDMQKGLIHTKDLVYFASFIGFFLFVTHQRVEAYRWR